MCAPRVTRHTSIRYSSSCHTRVNMGAFCLHRLSVSVNCLYHARMILSVGGYFAYFARSACCTVTTDLLVWYSNTQHNFSPGAAIFSLHTLASPSGRIWTTMKNNLLGKKFSSCSFYLNRFRKYVLYGFPTINFCNPGVHYETPCTTIKPSRTPVIHKTSNINTRSCWYSEFKGHAGRWIIPSCLLIWARTFPQTDWQSRTSSSEKFAQASKFRPHAT